MLTSTDETVHISLLAHVRPPKKPAVYMGTLASASQRIYGQVICTVKHYLITAYLRAFSSHQLQADP